MRAEYDFENSQINPYKKAPREKITIQLNVDVIDYFKAESVRIGIPYPSFTPCPGHKETRRSGFVNLVRLSPSRNIGTSHRHALRSGGPARIGQAFRQHTFAEG